MKSWNVLVAQLYGLRRFGIEPGLETIRAALAAEEHPDEDFDVITVAGTNGKGTVASMVAAILQEYGLRVGLYTSPHLIDVTERFRVDGVPLSRQVVAPVLRRLLDEYGRREDEHGEVAGLTFFEVTTLAAAVLFRRRDVDVAVFEVGLGGRLDAVNALEPSATAVTTIGRDHTRYLGTKIEDIAAEKAGIFREGVVAVIGQQELDAARMTLLEAARGLGAPIVEAGNRGSDDGSSVSTIEDCHRRTAVQIVRYYPKARVGATDVERGLRRWRWPGRFDEISLEAGSRKLLLDAAHNKAGLEALQRTWSHRFADVGAVIWTSMGDKEPGETKAFFEQVDAPVWGSLVDNERRRPPAELEEFVPSRLWRGALPTSDALEEASNHGSGHILAFGSIFLLGELLEAVGRKASQLSTYVGD